MRIAMYVDGWNFYCSLVEAKIKPYGWCDFPLLARQQTLQPDAEVSAKYFTSRDEPHRAKIMDRQIPRWWKALRLIGCQIIEGEFRSTSEEVEEQNRYANNVWREKQSDVALATHMMADANSIAPDSQCPGRFLWRPGYDLAVLLTGDTDFIPLVRSVSGDPFNRPVRVLLPPSRPEVQDTATRLWEQRARGRNVLIKQLGKQDLANALLPLVVVGNGGQAECDATWMWREKYQAEVAMRRGAVRKVPGTSV